MAKQVLFGYVVDNRATGERVLDSGEPHLVSRAEAIAASHLRVKHISPTPVSVLTTIEGDVVITSTDVDYDVTIKTMDVTL